MRGARPALHQATERVVGLGPITITLETQKCQVLPRHLKLTVAATATRQNTSASAAPLLSPGANAHPCSLSLPTVCSLRTPMPRFTRGHGLSVRRGSLSSGPSTDDGLKWAALLSEARIRYAILPKRGEQAHTEVQVVQALRGSPWPVRASVPSQSGCPAPSHLHGCRPPQTQTAICWGHCARPPLRCQRQARLDLNRASRVGERATVRAFSGAAYVTGRRSGTRTKMLS